MTEHNLKAEASMELRASATISVVRGEKSWTTLNTFAGFALTIEAALISMVDVLPWWVRCLLFLATGGVTLGLIRSNRQVQEWILAWTSRYQGKAR